MEPRIGWVSGPAAMSSSWQAGVGASLYLWSLTLQLWVGRGRGVGGGLNGGWGIGGAGGGGGENVGPGMDAEVQLVSEQVHYGSVQQALDILSGVG